MASLESPELIVNITEVLNTDRILTSLQLESDYSSTVVWKMDLGPYTLSMAHPNSVEDIKIKNSVLSWCDWKDKIVEEIIDSAPTEYFTKKCFQILHLAYSGRCFADIEACFDQIERLNNLIDNNKLKIESRYGKNGFTFVLEATRRHIMLTCGCSRRNADNLTSVFYKDLSELAKATVTATVVLFSRITQQSTELQKTLIEKALKYGTEIAEWNHLHFRILRSLRRDNEKTFRDKPSDTETDALGNAFRLDPKNNDILVSICKTLFDFIKYTDRGDATFSIRIGSLSFSSRVKTIESLCTKLRKLAGESFENNTEAKLLAGSVFISGRLPHGLKDAEFAKACLDKALEQNPTSGKVFQKLAVWYLMQKKDLVAANGNFKKAMEADPLGYLSVIDYCWTKCGDLRVENVSLIADVLAKLKVFKWPSHVLTDINFVKGCLMLGMGKEDCAAVGFKEAYCASPEYFATRCYTMHGSLRRSLWRMDIVNLDKALACVKSYIKNKVELSNEGGTMFQRMVNVMEEICQKKNNPRSLPFEYNKSESSGYSHIQI